MSTHSVTGKACRFPGRALSLQRHLSRADTATRAQGHFALCPLKKGSRPPPSPDFDLACPRFFPIAQRTVYDVKTQEVAEFHLLLLPATFRLCWRALPECPIQQSVIDDDGNQQRLKQATWFHLDDNFCGPTEQVYWAPLSRHSLRVPLFCMPPKTSARLTRSRSARG